MAPDSGAGVISAILIGMIIAFIIALTFYLFTGSEDSAAAEIHTYTLEETVRDPSGVRDWSEPAPNR